MTSLKEILSWFQKNKYPTQEQFKESWTSFWHKSEKMPMEQVVGLQDELSDKALKSDLNAVETELKEDIANVVSGLVPMGSVANLTELEAKPKRNNDAYYVEDQLSPEGDSYIYRWDNGLNLWVNTKQVVFGGDVARIKDLVYKADSQSSNAILTGHYHTIDFDLKNSLIKISPTLIVAIGNKRVVIPKQDTPLISAYEQPAILYLDGNEIKAIESSNLKSIPINSYVLASYITYKDDKDNISVSNIKNYMVNGINHVINQHPKIGIMSGDGYLNFSTTDGTVSVVGTILATDANRSIRINNSTVSVPLGVANRSILYVTSNGDINTSKLSSRRPDIPSDSIIICSYIRQQNTVDVNGTSMFKVNAQYEELIKFSRIGYVISLSTSIDLVTANGCLNINDTLLVSDGNRKYKATLQSVKLNDKKFSLLFISPSGEIKTTDFSSLIPGDSLIFASYYYDHYSKKINIEGIVNYNINGIPPINGTSNNVEIGLVSVNKNAVNINYRTNNTSNAISPNMEIEIKGLFIIISGNTRYSVRKQTAPLHWNPSVLYYDINSGLIVNLETSKIESIPKGAIIIATHNGAYSPDFFYINGIQHYTINGLNKEVQSFRKKHKIVLSNDLNDFYINNSTLSLDAGSNNPLISMDIDDVYSFWDQLVDKNPKYVSKKELVKIDTPKGEKAIYSYTFSPLDLTTESNADGMAIYKKNKVFLTASHHGFEKTCSIALYLLMKDICENTSGNNFIDAARNELEFVVIPISNPYAWVTNQRKNGNGIDLNRNYPRDWNHGNGQGVPSNQTYAGPTPLSEIETSTIYNYFNEVNNEGNVILALDIHNFYSASIDQHMSWFEGSSYAMNDIARAAILEFSRKLSSTLSSNGIMLGYVSEDIKGRGKAAAYYASKMLYSGTLECINKLSVVDSTIENDNNTLKYAATFFGNYIRHFLRGIIKDIN